MKRFFDDRLIAETGDITTFEVEAIVNAANSTLSGGGGVDGAIHRNGGPSILEECRDIRRRRYPDGLFVGKAVITTAGDLPSKHVIHTVGPVWRDGKSSENELLQSSYFNSLELAGETGMDSIAFPAISTGVYGYPKELAARIAFETVRDYIATHAKPRTVHLVFFSEKDLQTFLRSVV